MLELARDASTSDAITFAMSPTTVTGEAFELGLAYEEHTGRLASVACPAIADGVAPRTVTYDYHAASGLPLHANADGVRVWTAEHYDDQARLVAETLGNGTHAECTYGDLDREHVPWLEHIRTTGPSGNTLMDLSYTYDANENVLTRGESTTGRSESFSYDGLSRMRTRTLFTATGAGPPGTPIVSGPPTRTRSTYHTTVEHYDYDDLGNLTNNAGVTQTYSTTAPHQLTSVGSRCSTITLLGHTRSVGCVSTDARGRVTDTPDLHVTSYTDFDLPHTMVGRGGSNVTLLYGADGARARKIESDSVTTYVDGLYERRQERGSQTHTWNVPVAGRTVAQLTQVGTTGTISTNYLHVDRNGSPVLVTDAPATGEHYAYSPFGIRTRLDSVTTAGGRGTASHTVGLSPPPERPGFTGDDEDPELSAVNMHGRLYAPSIGRFITPDPLIGGRSRQEWNAYSYALNNPATLIDPSGFQNDDPGDGGWAAASAGGGLIAGAIAAVANFFGWGGGGSSDTTSTSGQTVSYATPTAPAPVTATATRMDSVGPSPSAHESSARQPTDALFSSAGAHRVGARIYDNLASAAGICGTDLDAAEAEQCLLGRMQSPPEAIYHAAAAIYPYVSPHMGGPDDPDPGAAAVRHFVSRVSDAHDAHVAGDDRALDDVVADTVSGVAIVTAGVTTGRVVGGVVAGDVGAAEAGGGAELAEAVPALETEGATVVATGTDSTGGAYPSDGARLELIAA